MFFSVFRKLIGLLLSFLIVGCYSYQQIPPDEVVVDPEMKYKIELVNGKKYVVEPLELSKDSLIVQYRNIQLPVYRGDILVIGERRFSWVKTVMAVLIPVGGIFLIGAIVSNNISINLGNSVK